MKRKHIPERTCIACRTTRPKRELVRLVRTLEGTVVIDDSGKRSGRGAYLCRQQDCWEQALKRGLLNRALRLKLSDEEIDALREYAVSLAVDDELASTAE
ncbi:MAG: YlxR family protein [Anaerolineae bacterium]|nr:YlxR family protein [Anaerolineae bacterium]